MAHTCPDCGCTCHCHGDIDDLVLDNDEDIACCTHCDRFGHEDDLDRDDFIEEEKNYYGDDLP